MLESVEEPHFMAPLDHDLAHFQMDISPWMCPKDWIDADANQVTLLIQVFVTSTKSAEIQDANFGGNMVHQVHFSYTIQLGSLNTDCSG
jgi:GH25 family lysozyme M1 (1,4-beta-N-acetylmuramidase)